jgi:hypothetical protein
MEKNQLFDLRRKINSIDKKIFAFVRREVKNRKRNNKN